jgi:hypothetical protein
MFGDEYLDDLVRTWEKARLAGERDGEVLGLLLEAAVRLGPPGSGERPFINLTERRRHVFRQRLHRLKRMA